MGKRFCIALVLLLSFLMPCSAFSQQTFNAKRVVKKALIGTSVVSNGGAAIVTEFGKFIHHVDTQSGKVTARFSDKALKAKQIYPLAVNDNGTILIVKANTNDDPQLKATCTVVKLNAQTRSEEILVSFNDFTLSDCVPRLDATSGNISASINNDGKGLVIYSEDLERKYLYFNQNMNEVVHTVPLRGIVPPPVHISEDGTVSSYIRTDDPEPGTLFFYSESSGVSLHTVPEILKFKVLIALSNGHYLFVDEFGVFGDPDEILVYTLSEDSRDSGTLLTTSSDEVKENLVRELKKVAVTDDVYLGGITPSGKLFGEIRNGILTKSRRILNQIVLYDVNDSNFLVKNTRGFPGKNKRVRFNKRTFVTDVDDSGNLYAFVSGKKGNGTGRVIRLSPVE